MTLSTNDANYIAWGARAVTTDCPDGIFNMNDVVVALDSEACFGASDALTTAQVRIIDRSLLRAAADPVLRKLLRRSSTIIGTLSRATAGIVIRSAATLSEHHAIDCSSRISDQLRSGDVHWHGAVSNWVIQAAWLTDNTSRTVPRATSP